MDMRGREEVTGQRQLHIRELHGLYCPQNIIRDECELDEKCKRYSIPCTGLLQVQRVPGA